MNEHDLSGVYLSYNPENYMTDSIGAGKNKRPKTTNTLKTTRPKTGKK